MAKYTLGSGVSQFFGSYGGATFQKCGTVFSIRKRSVIVQKRSSKQSKSKNIFGSKAQRWRNLTTNQKNSFINRATQYTRIDSLGNNYNQSGQNMQVGCNYLRFITNRTDLTVVGAPAAFTTIVEGSFVLDLGIPFMEFVLDPEQVQSGFDIMVFCSEPREIGFDPSTIKLKQIGSLLQNQHTGTQNFYTRYTSVFGDVSQAAGLTYAIRLDLIQNNSGQVRQVLYGVGVIEA